MAAKEGSLSINSENIFPIIKKWLYSDHDIFIRELISNGVDAISKIRQLSSLGEAELPEGEKYRVDVLVSPADKTLTFVDNGIGMTFEEVEKYINQIAFSGAAEFLEKYKDKDQAEQIIGHFGLGFYSAFMVSDKVVIETKSYREDAAPVRWTCEGGTTFEMEEGTYAERGTRITLYLSEDSLEFANEMRVRDVIQKYCAFMPVEIYLTNEDKAKEAVKDAVVQDKKKEEDDLIGDVSEDVSDDTEEKEEKQEEPLNDIHPLWTRNPSDVTDEEYKDFFQHVFLDFKEPLFWIHLNMDYPFRLKGILYFPRINPNVDPFEGKVKLFNNQVFVADNIREVIPEFLLTLKGVIDCPDLPLNVSRSALQNDGFVKKISEYITKKVADKLTGMYKTEKEKYEGLWEDLSPFVKFGCLKDPKFEEKMHDYMIYKNIEGKFLTLPEYLEAAKEKHENTVYYISDAELQASYIEMFKKEGMDALYMTHNIDNPFISTLEMKNENVKFLRIDADLSANMQDEEVAEEEAKTASEKLLPLMKKASGNENLKLDMKKLKDADMPALLLVSEQERRMAEMMKAYSFGGDLPDYAKNAETLVMNLKSSLVQYLLENAEKEEAVPVAEEIYDLAVLANQPLSADRLTAFISRTGKFLLHAASADQKDE